MPRSGFLIWLMSVFVFTGVKADDENLYMQYLKSTGVYQKCWEPKLSTMFKHVSGLNREALIWELVDGDGVVENLIQPESLHSTIQNVNSPVGKKFLRALDGKMCNGTPVFTETNITDAALAFKSDATAAEIDELGESHLIKSVFLQRQVMSLLYANMAIINAKKVINLYPALDDEAKGRNFDAYNTALTLVGGVENSAFTNKEKAVLHQLGETIVKF